MTENPFQHFLTFEELHPMGIGFGEADLSYWLDKSKAVLHISKLDKKSGEIYKSDYPVSNVQEPDKVILSNYLIDLMSHKLNLWGTPNYLSSDIFSRDEFNPYLDKGIEAIRKKKDLALQQSAENPIIEYCKSINLFPEPAESGMTNWEANCASKRNHNMMISTKSNTWACGYCYRKGTLLDLQEWVNEVGSVSH